MAPERLRAPKRLIGVIDNAARVTPFSKTLTLASGTARAISSNPNGPISGSPSYVIPETCRQAITTR